MTIDPIELRRRIEPEQDPTTRAPFSSRHLVKAYRDGAARFGWDQRDPTPGAPARRRMAVGMGVATATYPYYRMPGGRRALRLDADGRVDGVRRRATRWAWAPPRCRRSTPPTGWACRWRSVVRVRRQHAAGRHDRRRLVADRWHRGGGGGGGRGLLVPAAEARRQRQPARGTEDRRGRGARRRAAHAQGCRRGSESYASILARAKRDSSSKPRKPGRCRWSR